MKQNTQYENLRDIAPEIYVSLAQNTRCTAHFHKSIEMIYILEGGFQLTTSGKTYTTQADEIVYIPSLSTHLINSGESLSVTIVLPKEQLGSFENMIEQHSFETLLKDREFNRTHLRRYFTALTEPDALNPILQTGYLYSVFGLLLQRYPAVSEHGKNDNLIIDIINYINENFRSDITLASISSHFGYSKFYFSRLFDLYTNCTLKYYVNNVRVKYVAGQMMKKNCNVTKLAMEAGFNSVSTFYRCFSEVYKMSPSEALKKNILLPDPQ